MYKKLKSFTAPLVIMAGCTTMSAPVLALAADWESAYDDRDQIFIDEVASHLPPRTGVAKIIVAAVEWPGEKKLDPALLQKQVFSSDPTSLRSYILAASNGKLELTGEVITHVSDRARPEVCNSTTYPFTLAVEEGTKAIIANGLDPNNYDYQFNIVDCGGYGSAQVGGKQLSIYGQASGTYIYWHEFAHNLGSNHGNTITQCPQSGETVTAPTGCTLVAYGDTGNPVGGGYYLLDAKARQRAGWLTDNELPLIEETGIYHMGVLGRAGVQGYRMNRPGSELVMEYRQPGPTPYDDFSQDDNRAKGVWIKFNNRSSNLITTQIDGTPHTVTTADPTFLPGKVLVDDASKTKVKVCAAGTAGAVVATAIDDQQLPDCDTPFVTAPPPDARTGPTVVFSGNSALANATITVISAGNPTDVLMTTETDALGNWSGRSRELNSPRTYFYQVGQAFTGQPTKWSESRVFRTIDR